MFKKVKVFPSFFNTNASGEDKHDSRKVSIMTNYDKPVLHGPQMTKDELKRQFLEIVKDCGERSSIHSFPSFSSDRVPKLVKFIWLLSIAVSWGFFIYQVNNSINLYNSYGITSSTSIGFEAPTYFPAVDICNLNPYDGHYPKTRMIMNETLTAKNITPYKYASLREYTDAANNYFKATIEYLYKDDLVEIQNLGFFLDQILLSCTYEGKTCNATDFYFYHDYNFGSCYRFNGGPKDPNQTVTHQHISSPIKTLHASGWRNGLRLELYSGDPTIQQQYTYKTGFRVIVHNQSVVPVPDEDGVDVAAGLQTNLAISRTFVNHLPSPYNDCIDKLTAENTAKSQVLADMYDQIQKGLISQYMQKYCLKLCYQYFVIDTCHCASMSFSYLHLTSKNASACITDKDISCMEYADLLFYNSSQVNTCYSYCSIECTTVLYELQARTAQYPTKWYADMFKKYQDYFGLYEMYSDLSSTYDGPTYDMISKTTAFVNVFYYSMQFEVVTETPTLTFDLLLANIGGNLGLFTGMSILSFMELIEVIMTIVIIAFMTKK